MVAAMQLVPSFELPPPAPPGRLVVVHGDPDFWWVDGQPPLLLAQPPGETWLLAFDEPATRDAFRWTMGRREAWVGHRSVDVLEEYEPAEGRLAPCLPSGCGCLATCGPQGTCGHGLDRGWFYRASLAELDALPPPIRTRAPAAACWGERLDQQYCVACHDQSAGRGPPLVDIHLGDSRMLTDGRVVEVTPDYLRTAILDHGEHQVAGYREASLPFRFSDRQLDGLLEYVQETPGARTERRCAHAPLP